MRSYIVMDTEFTTWEGAMARNWSAPGERREIVQIGAIKIVEHKEISRFVRYVKPVFNPILSDYFIRLIGITQEIVDQQGVSFHQALDEYRAFCGNLASISYGRDDFVLEENLGWHCETVRMASFLDARDLVAEIGRDPRQWTSGTVYRLAGIEQPGTREHDAMDDCLSLAAFVASKEVEARKVYGR